MCPMQVCGVGYAWLWLCKVVSAFVLPPSAGATVLPAICPPFSPENVPFQPEIESGGRTLREKWLSRDMAVLQLCRALSPELVP